MQPFIFIFSVKSMASCLILVLMAVCWGEVMSQGIVFPAKLTDGTCLSELEPIKQISAEVIAALTGQTQYSPVSSCSALPADSTSGYYWIRPVAGQQAVQLYCDFDRQCGCDGASTWTHVAFLNMSDPNQNCPSGWELASTPVRACTGRGLSTNFECNSAFFSTHQLSYSRVCGCVIAYQHGQPDAFYELIVTSVNIDGAYVDGVSITHGSEGSRQHIWTFAAAQGDSDLSLETGGYCDCTTDNVWPHSTEFVGNNYSCNSGNHETSVDNNAATFYQDDPLWDGAGCSINSTCCQFNSPPWFCRALLQPTTDDLEVRICHARGPEDTPVQLVELYVQ